MTPSLVKTSLKFVLHCRACCGLTVLVWMINNTKGESLFCTILQAVEDEEVRAALLKEVKKQEVRLSKDCFS